MNKTYLVVIVVLILLVGGFFLFKTLNFGSTQPKSSSKTVQTFTMEEVASHKTRSDCWTVIDNKVYDLTKFIPNHEGGDVIVEACGIDATRLFKERPNTENEPHPPQADLVLETLYIGDLKN